MLDAIVCGEAVLVVHVLCVVGEVLELVALASAEHGVRNFLHGFGNEACHWVGWLRILEG